MRASNSKRRALAGSAIGLSALYLILGIAFKSIIDRKVEASVQHKGVAADKYFTTPTPLNNLLWYIVIRNDSGYSIGYRSVLDKAQNIDFHFVYRNDSLLRPSLNSEDVRNLLRFSNGYYAAQMWHDTLVFNDLRFGEMLGWASADSRFVFHYFLSPPADNKLIVQRGRFAGWNKAAIKAFLTRIKGI
jgi:inner membrane protein